MPLGITVSILKCRIQNDVDSVGIMLSVMDSVFPRNVALIKWMSVYISICSV